MRETIMAKADDRAKRLDIFLAERLKDRLSRNQIKQLIEKGNIVVVGQGVKKPNYRLTGKEAIEILLPDSEKTDISPEDIHLDIVYEDDDILVVNKPQGMVVHPATGNSQHTLVNAVLFHTNGKLSHIGTSTRPGIVHRLDKEVSGLMVLAKNDTAHQVLMKQFQARMVKRRYIAFVKGGVTQSEANIALPIGRAQRDRKKMAVRFLNSKEAITDYKVLGRFERHTKLELNLGTGRTHQIRVHMSYIGHPIIGDTKYGGGKFKRIALYAAELSFKHPHTGKQMHFSIDMPAELKWLEL